MFNSVLACAKPAAVMHVFQKLFSCDLLCGLCLSLSSLTLPRTVRIFIAFSGPPTAVHCAFLRCEGMGTRLHTDTQDNYCNTHCTCVPRVNNSAFLLELAPACCTEISQGHNGRTLIAVLLKKNYTLHSGNNNTLADN